ncbi:MAG TPA: hypothetical protein VFM77_15805 [Terriglobales bacterium]|nr:hypothetical protein [Terriglobales bacterium]
MLQGEIGYTNLSFEIVQTGVLPGVHQLRPKLLDSTFKILNVMAHSKFHADSPSKLSRGGAPASVQACESGVRSVRHAAARHVRSIDEFK